MSTIGKYSLVKSLGAGQYGKVKLAIHQDTKEQVALKIMKRKNVAQAFIDLINNECEIHSQLKHKNIIELKEYNGTAVEKRPSGRTRDVFYIALELAKGGELFEYISQTGEFSEDVARYFFHQIIEALDYMNNKGISHRDLKPENILMSDKFSLKIADFGFGSNSETNTSKKGT